MNWMTGSPFGGAVVPFLQPIEDAFGAVAAGAGAIAGAVRGALTPPQDTAGDMTLQQLQAAMPASRNAATYLGPINTAFRNYGINLPQQRAAFLAHVSVECGQLNGVVENLNYSAKRMTQVWHRRFPTIAAATPYAHNPEALANHTYGGRNGNGDEASGDGWRYRGRGLLQITGRTNYRAAGFEDNPEALENPNTAADTAGRHWKEAGLNERTTTVLNRTQFNATTQLINGGQTGSAERWAAYQVTKRALLPQPARRSR